MERYATITLAARLNAAWGIRGLFLRLSSSIGAQQDYISLQPLTAMHAMTFLHRILFLLSALMFVASASAGPLRRDTYQNPIKPGVGADPWVLQYGDSYYLLYTTGNNVSIRKSSNLAQFDVDEIVLYTPDTSGATVWAPELHYINNQFYIYVSISPDGANENHRMYVLEATDSSDPTKPFNMVGKMNTADDNWAIDGTVLIYENGINYFIWSGWTDSSNQLVQNLYIAQMSSPTQLTGDRVLVHEPNPSWQQSGSNKINEGPEILVNAGRTFLIYSAAGSWTADYCLAMMGIDGGADPMVVSNWWTLDDRSVFWKSDAAFGPGHASFPYDRNGVPYIAYHAMASADAGWDGRTIRTETYGWNSDNSPAFPSPAGLDQVFNLPA